MKIKSTILIVLVLLSLAFVQPAKAQSCDSAIIVDMTGTLDKTRICEAAQTLDEFGYSVFIYYTSESFDYRIDQNGNVISDDWYARLDQVEAQHGMRDANGPIVSLFALEVSTTPLRTMLVGNVNSPLEANWQQIKSELEFWLDSSATEAFVRALEKATEIEEAAHVVPGVIPTNPPSPTPTPAPTRTPRPPFLSTAQGQKFLSGAIRFVIGLAALGAFVVGYLFLFVPWNNRRKRIALLKKQLADLKSILFDLIERCSGLFGGDNVEGTAIYRLWFVNGGQKQREDQQVRLDVERGRQAFTIVNRDNQLRERLLTTPDAEEGLRHLIEELETAYLLFVGTSSQVLRMSTSEIDAEFNPLLVTGERHLDDQLVQQAQAMTQKWSGGALKINLMFADPSRVDERGILGSISDVKQHLFNLVQAQDKAPGQVAGAGQLRKEVGKKTEPPFGSDKTRMFVYIDNLLQEAQKALDEKRWTDAGKLAGMVLSLLGQLPNAVKKLNEAYAAIQALQIPNQPRVPNKEKLLAPIQQIYLDGAGALEFAQYDDVGKYAQAVIKACVRLAELLTAYLSALTQSDLHRSKIQKLQTQGFEAPVGEALAEVESDIKIVRQALTEGDYAKADEYIREILEDSTRALKIIESLVRVHEKNRKELIRLSKEVARVFAVRLIALPVWTALQAYPKPNWQDVSGMFGVADAALSRLFDEPDDVEDLASRINTLNESKKQSSVIKAEAELVQAFLELQDAESKLNQVIQQSSRVKAAEAEVEKARSETEAALQAARTFIVKNDLMVEKAMEGLLEQAETGISQAAKQIASREFIPAQVSLATARELVTRALTHAKEEVAEITRLYDQLAQVRSSAEKSVRLVQTNMANMTPAARKASASATVDEAGTTLRQAQAAEAACTGKEDHALAESLQKAMNLYTKAENLALDADRRMKADLDEYRGLIRDVNNSIGSASSAIAAAARYVQESDAGNAGYSALQRAQNSLPDKPREGEAVDALRRRREAAESASTYARQAQSEAQSRIRQAEAAREAERQRQLAQERARQAEIRRQEEARQEARRREEAAERRREDDRRHTQMMQTQRHTASSLPTRHTTIGGGTRRH